MTISSIKSYLPFTASPASTPIQLASKLALATSPVWTACSYWAAFCEASNPFGICAALPSPFFRGLLTVLSAGVAINCETEAGINKDVEAFLKAENPSAKLMKKILDSSATLDKLLEKISAHPEILIKKNEQGHILLLQFADQTPFSYRLAGPVVSVNHLENLKEIYDNQNTLKKLLLSGNWDKTDLFHTLAVVNRKNSQLLASWPDVKQQILKRKDLVELEQDYIEELWTLKQ